MFEEDIHMRAMRRFLEREGGFICCGIHYRDGEQCLYIACPVQAEKLKEKIKKEQS